MLSVDGRTLINFASNDYLGLSKHPALKQRAIEFIERFGAGSGSSRLVSGNLEAYEQLERKIAAFKGTEAALVLPSGYQTNATVIAALGRKQTVLFSDHENHNSIAVGLQLAQGKWFRYSHNDLTHLETRLQQHIAHDERTKWVVSETVFSMDGDATDVNALNQLATAFGASVYLDEAHATGVLGPEGRGLCFGKGTNGIVMGTFSKAMGSFGAYIACSKIMREYLVNFCSGLIYSTALPPAVLGSIDAALDVVPELESEREQLQSASEHVRVRLQAMGFATGRSTTQIIPIVIGEDDDALKLAQYLEENEILAPAIRPPTVLEGEARVRISLTAKHTPEQIHKLLATIAKFSAVKTHLKKESLLLDKECATHV
ncbi:MAG TPA: 8-amino-7-oxononanoate synthase [Drouetiella sp.]